MNCSKHIATIEHAMAVQAVISVTFSNVLAGELKALGTAGHADIDEILTHAAIPRCSRGVPALHSPIETSLLARFSSDSWQFVACLTFFFSALGFFRYSGCENRC